MNRKLMAEAKRAAKISPSVLLGQVAKQNAQLDAVNNLLRQALSHRRRLERAVKAMAYRDGTCWCNVRTVALLYKGKELLMHTAVCDNLFLALYGSERGE